MRWSVLVMLVFSVEVMAGRMYQWVDPDTGTPYLSGSPPAWYRSQEGGPRVQVYDDGKLVDDTEWRADKAREAALRKQALAAEQARQEAEKERLLAARRQQVAGQDQEQEQEQEQALDAANEPEAIKALVDDLLERYHKASLKAATEQEGDLRAAQEGSAGQ